MNKVKFENICQEKNLNPEVVLYNCGYDLEDIKLHGGKTYKPFGYFGGKPKYIFDAQYEIILEDCV